MKCDPLIAMWCYSYICFRNVPFLRIDRENNVWFTDYFSTRYCYRVQRKYLFNCYRPNFSYSQVNSVRWDHFHTQFILRGPLHAQSPISTILTLKIYRRFSVSLQEITTVSGISVRYVENKIVCDAQSYIASPDGVIKWKHFPRYWPFVRGIHRSSVNPLTKASDAELWCFLSSVPE